MVWQTHGNGTTYCAIHDLTFETGVSVCSECASAAVEQVDGNVPPSSDRELELMRDEFRADAKMLRRKAREWLEDGTARERLPALKAIDVAVKCDRAALEIQLRIADREHDRWLVEQNRLLQRDSAH